MNGFDKIQTKTVNKVSLAYREAGDGPPLVLIHGESSDLRTWDSQLATFATNFRSIAYSRRYARPNVDIDDGLDDQTMPHVEDLISLVEELKLGPTHLVGHSWGGSIALVAAMRRPDLVSKLVLIEPPVISLFIDIPPRPSQLLKLLFRNPRLAGSIIKFATRTVGPSQKLFARSKDEEAARTFAVGILGEAAYETMSDERKRQARENRKADKAQVTGAGFPPIHRDEVSAVSAPSLLLHGANGVPMFREMLAELERILPDAHLVSVPGASHLVHEDNPQFVNEVVVDFLCA